MSKAIYRPKGRAREYSPWACNLYVGCQNDCTYCFNKRGFLGSVMGGPKAELKQCFKDEEDAFKTFVKELKKHQKDIIRDGDLLFSFTSDPCLPETIDLTFRCLAAAVIEKVPCLILTKKADWILNKPRMDEAVEFLFRDYLAVGFTLTGCDELEPGASPNIKRIEAMHLLHETGIKTFASIEPVIDFKKSFDMIRRSVRWCDHYKIGLLSGDRHAYDRYLMPYDLETFVFDVNELLTENKKTVYWKKSVTDTIGHPITDPCCVDADYRLIKAH